MPGRMPRELLPGVIWCGSALEAPEKADIALVVTKWNEFRALDLNTLKGRMRGDVLVDLRNIYLPAQARAAGFNYTSVGQAGRTIQVCRGTCCCVERDLLSETIAFGTVSHAI